MAEAFTYLAYILIIFLIGLAIMLISKKIRFPSYLLLIVVGIVLGNISYGGKRLIVFDYKSNIFIEFVAFFLVLILFDISSRFRLKEIDSVSSAAARLSAVFSVISIIVLSVLSIFMVKGISPLLAVLFAAAVIGTGYTKHLQAKMFQFLETESVLSTLLAVLIPFLLLDFFRGAGFGIPFLQGIIAGIGVGVLIGLIAFKFFSRLYHFIISPLILVAAALLTYFCAGNAGGNGFIAVIALGLFFGNIHLKHKVKLDGFSKKLSSLLGIFVFVLAGYMINIKSVFGKEFLIVSLALFAAFIAVRLFSVMVSFSGKQFNAFEKLYMALNAPKGIAVGVVLLALMVYISYPGLDYIINLMFAFLVYSLILSLIVTKLIRVEKP